MTTTDVVVIGWPEDRSKAAELKAAGVPLLYLVRPDDDPPEMSGCLEDWVRVGSGDRDLHARLAALELRAASHAQPPFVDDEDRLHHRGGVLALDETEARMARVLTERVGTVVPDEDLAAVLSNGGAVARSLRTEIARLRARLRALHLNIVRSRSRGYVLMPSSRSPR
jgi:DNA-binding response OmpR family regulator